MKKNAPSPAAAAPLPVSAARNGFTPAQATDFLERYGYEEVLKSGDVALFFLLNANNKIGFATIPRAGTTLPLARRIDAAIGNIRVKGEFGTLSLNRFLADPRPRVQGVAVVHKGRIVFEQYPGMREHDNHVWMSVHKTAASLVIALLVEEGRIDLAKPIDTYLPALRGSAYAGVSVRDVLDMAAGLDNVETQAARLDARSIAARHNFAANGVANADGKVERAIDVALACRREKPAGQAFDYSSVNTIVLGMVAEHVENKRWADIWHERVWSKMTVEGDMMMNVAGDGAAHVEGMAMSRLRDMARYGMLYTPSWKKAARERIVSAAYAKRIHADARREIFLQGELGQRLVEKYFPASPPVANSWQWDALFADGDMFKSGSLGQGLYVSPARDLVVVWFSTNLYNDMTRYARAIALKTPQ